MQQIRHQHVAAPVPDPRADDIVSALVAQDLLSPQRRAQATGVVTAVLASQRTAAAPLRRRLSELAGYLGGVFVVTAAVILFATRWDSFTEGQRVAVLAGATVVLGLAALGVGSLGRGFSALRRGAEPVLRRLSGVLLLAAAGTAGAAAGLQVERLSDVSYSPTPVLVGFGVYTALAVAAYLLSPTVAGQVGIAGGVLMTVPAALDVIGNVEAVAFGLVVLSVSAVWLLLAERGLWHETGAARVVGATLAVVGAQAPVFDWDARWVGYVALFAVAAAGFGLYVSRRAWPYLAVGVVSLTLVVPEALLDWSDDSLGPAGALLAAGVTLLGSSLLGLRLRGEQSVTRGKNS